MEKEVNWKANGKEPLTYKNAFIHVCNWTFFPLNYLELFRVIIHPPMIRANNCEKNQSFPYKLDRILKISNIRIPIKIRLCDFSHISNSYPSLLLNSNVNQSKEEEEKKKRNREKACKQQYHTRPPIFIILSFAILWIAFTFKFCNFNGKHRPSKYARGKKQTLETGKGKFLIAHLRRIEKIELTFLTNSSIFFFFLQII